MAGPAGPYLRSMSTAMLSLSRILARDAMHTPIVACGAGTDLGDVAALMAEHRVHCVVVDGISRDGNGEHLVWAVVSDLDLVRAAVSADPTTTAGHIARTPALSVDVDDDLVTVATLLVDTAASHAVVIEGERPAGVISTLDIVSAVPRPGLDE